MKKKLHVLYISAFICILVLLFIGATLEKPLKSKTEPTEMRTALSTQADTSDAFLPVNELNPTNLKNGTVIFAEISDLELNQQFARKKDILNSAALTPKLTNHPVLDNLVEQCFAEELSKLPDTFSKAKYCYDWLVQNCTFGGGTVFMQDMYVFLGDCDYCGADGAIVYDAYRMFQTRQGVCDNYASALTVLLRYIGLDAFPVHGKAILTDGTLTNHVWVSVQTDGQYYFFDPQVESSAAKGYACMYALFCADSDAVPYCTDYDLESEKDTFHDFSLSSSLTAACTVSSTHCDPLVYRPGDVNAYGSVIRYGKIDSNPNAQEVPIHLCVSGGTAPYRCTLTVEFVQNGKTIHAVLANAYETSETVSAVWKPPQGTERFCVIAEISDAENRNLTCVLS